MRTSGANFDPKKKMQLETNLGQQIVISWELQIILGVPIFSQQTHLKKAIKPVRNQHSYEKLTSTGIMKRDIKIEHTNPSSEISISW